MDSSLDLERWKSRFPGEWLALRVTDQTTTGEPVGQLLAHHPNEAALYRILCRKRIEQAYVVSSEMLPTQGYIVLFGSTAVELGK